MTEHGSARGGGAAVRRSPLAEASAIAAEGRTLDEAIDLSAMSDEAVLAHYEGLCVQIAYNIYQSMMLRTASVEDMRADARLGLMDAWRRYDPGTNLAFSTFAYYRIRGSVMDGLRKSGVLRRRSEAKGRLAQSVAAIREAQVSVHSPSARDRTRQVMSQLDEAVANSGVAWMVIGEALSREREATEERGVVGTLLEEELRGALVQALDELDPLERETIERMYFGGESLTAIGAGKGLSRSWMCRVHTRALETLHQSLRGRGVV